MLANDKEANLIGLLRHWSTYMSDSGTMVVDNLKPVEFGVARTSCLYSDLLHRDRRRLMIATNCMKFNDAAYYVRQSAEPAGLEVEYKWYPAGQDGTDDPDLIWQTWVQVVLRKVAKITETVEVFQPTRKVTMLENAVHSGPLHSVDTKCNAVLAIGANGQKMPLSECDKLKYVNLPLLPKFDGTRATLLLDDNRLLIFSSVLRAIKHHGKGVGCHRYLMQGELLQVHKEASPESATDDYVVCVTGLMEVDGERRNVNDHAAMHELGPVVRLLETLGVFLTAFSRCATITGNFARVHYKGRAHYVKVDGINVPVFGEYGKFLKPLPFCTVDSTTKLFPSQIAQGLGKLFLTPPDRVEASLKVTNDGNLSYSPDDVLEFTCCEFPFSWKVSRVRPDKSRPASDSRVTLDLACASTASAVLQHRGNTVQDLYRFLRIEVHQSEDNF